jgi:hypothetical protein
MLTEAYHLTYEGAVSALSADGRLIRIYVPQGQPATTGDVMSLLSGPAAGQFRRIAQVIDPVTYLVDEAIPKGTEAVSIARGFVGESFERNRIDIRGGKLSAGMVFVGNHFGTRVVKNHLLGGVASFKFTACPTETPVAWGWSHAPFLGGVIEDNILEDHETGGLLGVEHSPHNKSNKGRTYMTIALNRNVLRWSSSFLSWHAQHPDKPLPPPLTLGYAPSHDPGELVVAATGNRFDAAAGAQKAGVLLIHAALFNSQRLLNRRIGLSPETTGNPDPRKSRAASSSPRRAQR